MNLAKQLGPSYLRVGGITADETIFDVDGRYERTKRTEVNRLGTKLNMDDRPPANYIRAYTRDDNTSSIIMTKSDWLKLNEFCTCVGWKLIFDLNLLKRTGDQWNSSNARQLIHFSENRFHVNWELGNEPISYPHNMGTRLSPEQVGEGFNELRRILRTSSWWESSLLVGPDINRVGSYQAYRYLARFLRTAGHSIDGITFHQYDLNGNTGLLSNFTNLHILYRVFSQTKQIIDARDRWAPHAQVWLGETASAYDGGVKGVSNSYADGFTWLDKLGITARMGVNVVVRQAFLGGDYTLIDFNFNPVPDYWLTLLYKRLVGNKVLGVNSGEDLLHQRFRIYAHCNKYSRYAKGSVVIYFINLEKTVSNLLVRTQSTRPVTGHLYLLEPGQSGNLTSKSVRLNGKVLRLTSSNSIPPLPPKRIEQSKLRRALSVPSLTFGFLVLEGVNARACMDGK